MSTVTEDAIKDAINTIITTSDPQNATIDAINTIIIPITSSELQSATLGSVTLSNLQTAILRQGQYIPEHQIPGREGGITESLGLSTYRVELHGFMESGDANKATMLDMKDTQQILLLPSRQIESNAWFYANMLIDEVRFLYPRGRSYPYYEYVIHAVFPSTPTLLATPNNIAAPPTFNRDAADALITIITPSDPQIATTDAITTIIDPSDPQVASIDVIITIT